MSANQDSMSDAIAAIKSRDHNRLRLALKEIPDVIFGDSILLRLAVSERESDSVRILLGLGAKPNESIMESAARSFSLDIISALTDAEPSLIEASGYRVLQILFVRVAYRNDTSPLNVWFNGLTNRFGKEHDKPICEALSKVGKAEAATWLTVRLLHRPVKV